MSNENDTPAGQPNENAPESGSASSNSQLSAGAEAGNVSSEGQPGGSNTTLAVPPSETLPAAKKIPRGAAIKPGNRESIADHFIDVDVANENTGYAFKNFTRLNARERKFRKVNFQHCVFDACYFNICVFDSCDFTGCRFVGCNFHRTTFAGCTFDYALFERSHFDDDILRQEAPRTENLKMRFARSLRMNFQQIGDAKAVNKAISLELEATSTYLRKSWASEETYYRAKYPGWKRVPQFIKWSEFRILDFIWGNGESAGKLLRTIFLIHILIALYDTIKFGNALNLADYWASFSVAPGIFFGIASATTHTYPVLIASCITASRLLGLALFTAILVKRFGRR